MAVDSSPRELKLQSPKHPSICQRKGKPSSKPKIQKFSKFSLDNTTFLQLHFEHERERKYRLKEAKTWPQRGFPPLVDSSEQQQSRLQFKKVTNRIPSATGMCINPETKCNREFLNDNQICRHFCELLGPALCCDCTEKRERIEGIKVCEEKPCLDRLERDPFSAFVNTHYNSKPEYDTDEEILVNDLSDEEQWMEKGGTYRDREKSGYRVNRYTLSPSPPPGDSGYSSRLSYIRSVTRAQSCDLFISLPATPTSPPQRENSRIRNRKFGMRSGRKKYQTESDQSNWSYSFDRGVAGTLGRLEERTKLNDFMKTGSTPSSVKSALTGSCVGPVLMELKLINFTQYDKLEYGPLDIAVAVKEREAETTK